MPIYEYQCEDCGDTFEVFQKVSDPPPQEHSCGSQRVKRVLSHTSFVLKGTGWYITDYGRKDTGGGSEKHGTNGKAKREASNSDTKSDATTKTAASSNSSSSSTDSKAGGGKAPPASAA